MLELVDRGIPQLGAVPRRAVQQLIFDRLTPAQVRQLTKLADALLESPVEVRPVG